MKANKESEAYDLSLFEPADKKPAETNRQTDSENKKKNNVIKFQPGVITKSQRRKRNPLIILSVALLTIVASVVAITIVQSNVILNELNQQILEANKTITQQNNLAAQYQLKVDSKLSSNLVQNYAETKLGMTQAKNAQKKFISLSDGDYAEVIRDDGKNNALETITEAFTGLWS